MISTNQFKNGAHIEVDGTIFRIMEFQHVKPGKGGAFVRTKLRKIDDGSGASTRPSGRERSSARAHRVAQDAVPLRLRRDGASSWTAATTSRSRSRATLPASR